MTSQNEQTRDTRPLRLAHGNAQPAGATSERTKLQRSPGEATKAIKRSNKSLAQRSSDDPTSTTPRSNAISTDSMATRIPLSSTVAQALSSPSRAEAIKSDIRELLKNAPRRQLRSKTGACTRDSQSPPGFQVISQDDGSRSVVSRTGRKNTRVGAAQDQHRRSSSTIACSDKLSSSKPQATINPYDIESNKGQDAPTIESVTWITKEAAHIESRRHYTGKKRRNRPQSVDMWDVVSICPRLLLFLPCECNVENPCFQLCQYRAAENHKRAEIGSNKLTVRVMCPEFLAFKSCLCQPCMIFNNSSWHDVDGEEAFVDIQQHPDTEYQCLPEVLVPDYRKTKKNRRGKKHKDTPNAVDSILDVTSFVPLTASTIPATQFPSLVASSTHVESSLQSLRICSPVTTKVTVTPQDISFPPLGTSSEDVDPWISARKKVTSTTYATIISKDTVASNVRKFVRPPSEYEQWDTKERFWWIQQNLSVAIRNKYISYHQLDRPAVGQPGEGSTEVQSRTNSTQWHYFSILPAELQTLIWQFSILKSSATVYVRYQPSKSGDTGKIQYLTQDCRLRSVCRETRYLCDNDHGLRFSTASARAEVPFHFKRHKLFIHNTASFELEVTLMSITRSDRNQIRYLCIPLRDFISCRHSTIRALCECANLMTIWFVSGQSVQDQVFLEEHYKDIEGLRKYIKSYLDPCWKRRWSKNPDYARVREKVPRVEFEVIGAFRAAEMKIDNLRWM